MGSTPTSRISRSEVSAPIAVASWQRSNEGAARPLAGENRRKNGILAEEKERSDRQAEHRGDHRNRGVDREVLGRSEEAEGRPERDHRIRRDKAHDERAKDGDASYPAARSRCCHEDNDLCRGLGPDPVQHADGERRSLAVVGESILVLWSRVMVMPRPTVVAVVPVGRIGRFVGLVHDPIVDRTRSGTLADLRSRPTRPPPNSGEHQHPAAPQTEVAPMTDQRDEHVNAEYNERDPHDLRHELVDVLGQTFARHDRKDAEGEHDARVAYDVQRPEQYRVTAFLLRARDVGDRRDVIPVDPVAEPEPESRNEQPEAESVFRQHPHLAAVTAESASSTDSTRYLQSGATDSRRNWLRTWASLCTRRTRPSASRRPLPRCKVPWRSRRAARPGSNPPSPPGRAAGRAPPRRRRRPAWSGAPSPGRSARARSPAGSPGSRSAHPARRSP